MFPEWLYKLGVYFANLVHQRNTCHQYTLRLVLDEFGYYLNKIFNGVWYVLYCANRG